jgi:hypothetical protein
VPSSNLARPVHLTAVILFFCCAGLLRAQGLKTIDNPDGGQLVYGSVTGQTTPQGAVATALRYTHGSFGDRPRIGTIFQSKDGQTFGVAFSLTAVKLGNKPISGLIMVSMSGAEPQAAVLYDEKGRFLKTQPEMLHTLAQLWAEQAQSASGSSNQAPARVPVLHMVSGGDGSGHIGLPDDWHITGMSGGQCTAEGPHGEFIGLGIQYQGIQDPNLRSNLRFNAPGARAGLAYPIGGNLFNAWVSITNQMLQRNGKPPGSFTFVSGKDTPAGPGEKAIEIHYEADLHDGHGPRVGTARIGEVYTQGMPTWMMTVQTSNIPKPYLDAEQPTVNAILRTFNQDVGVINRELQSSLANTRAIGERSRQQAADADASRIASTAAFNQHMDDLSIASKVQQNYTMDRTQLQDNDLALRGAVDNNVAAALIRANPDRYQEVPSTSFLKGVDY